MLSGGPCTHAQLEALSTVLFKQLRFRYEPVEWVYDGLAPVLLPEVLQRRKGIPLSLCLVVVAVGARLGMPLQLVCAQDALLPGVASGEAAGGSSTHLWKQQVAGAGGAAQHAWMLLHCRWQGDNTLWTAWDSTASMFVEVGALLARADCSVEAYTRSLGPHTSHLQWHACLPFTWVKGSCLDTNPVHQHTCCCCCRLALCQACRTCRTFPQMWRPAKPPGA
jgi:hypothetical protein